MIRWRGAELGESAEASLCQQLGLEVIRREAAGGTDLSRDDALIEASSQSPAAVVLVVDGWEAPDKATRRFVQSLRQSGAAERPVFVTVLLGAADAPELSLWRDRVRLLEDPLVSVEPYVTSAVAEHAVDKRSTERLGPTSSGAMPSADARDFIVGSTRREEGGLARRHGPCDWRGGVRPHPTLGRRMKLLIACPDAPGHEMSMIRFHLDAGRVRRQASSRLPPLQLSPGAFCSAAFAVLLGCGSNGSSAPSGTGEDPPPEPAPSVYIPSPLHLRLRNSSDLHYGTINVQAGGEWIEYGPLPPNMDSSYLRADGLNLWPAVRARSGEDIYVYLPIDNLDPTIAPGHYTLALSIDDFVTHSLSGETERWFHIELSRDADPI